jgi:hypothetical protein
MAGMKSVAVQIAATTTIVVAVPQKVVRVYAWSLSGQTLGDDGLILFQSSGGTILTGWRYMTGGQLPWDMPMATLRPSGRLDSYFDTLTGEGLVLQMQQAFNVGGFVCFEYAQQ